MFRRRERGKGLGIGLWIEDKESGGVMGGVAYLIARSLDSVAWCEISYVHQDLALAVCGEM